MLGLVRRYLWMLLVAAVAVPCLAQETAKATLETSETLFTVLAAINQCGYDQELSASDPVREQVRSDVAAALRASPAAAEAGQAVCAFYRDHQPADPSRDLAQYISLALNLTPPPDFALTLKEADLPPDASYVLGLVPLLKQFYAAANVHAIWTRHSAQYQALVEHYHEPVANLLLQTDVYLKIPISGFVGRHFTIYLEPLAAPGQVNARIYGSNYMIVVAPESGTLKMQQIRHTYLHFLLEPLAQKRGSTMARLRPLLTTVKTAPIDESFWNDISLLVTESLIRAIEARLSGAKGKAGEAERARAADDAVREGFILTRYFYEQLIQFEKSEIGVRDSYGDWLYYLDVERERKRASQVEFASKSAPEVLRPVAEKPGLLMQAEARLAANDPVGAQHLAQQALDSKLEDAGTALFILGQAASLNKDMQAAQGYFERTVQVSRKPYFLGRAHIYLGRIFDLKGERDEALKHYRAALEVDSGTPRTKLDAEAGLKQAYEPPRKNP